MRCGRGFLVFLPSSANVLGFAIGAGPTIDGRRVGTGPFFVYYCLHFSVGGLS